MTLLETINSISAIISSFRDIIIIVILIFGVRYIGQGINRLIEHLPEYLEKWDKIKMKSYRIETAMGKMKI